MTHKALRSLALLPFAALVLGGCADSSDDASDSTGGGEISIVASTNVYGDIAQAVAGDEVTVTSIITSSTQDPHEYEASAQDRLALDDASIVIENGGGYDPFIDTMLEASDTDPTVLTAVDISGLLEDDHAHDEEGHDEEEGHEGHDHIEGFNEHVWYDFHTVEKVAEELSDELTAIDPDNASTYAANYAALAEQIEGLETAASDLRATADGKGVAITEPVPLYLLSEAGLVNQTPEEFSEAVEEGADVPVRVLQQTLDLFSGQDIALLAYNEQTADGTTEQVRAAAEKADVPVVDFTETLPEGQSYVEWQQANIDNLAAALQ
jgi:zinc/manganese transport system substrate-binding protein